MGTCGWVRAMTVGLLLGPPVLAKDPVGRVVWENRMEGLGQGTAAVADGVIYASVREGSAFAAVDARNGKVAWRTPLSDTSPFPPILDEDSAYVITGSCTLYRIARSSGKVVWSRWLSSSIHSMPALSQGRLYAAAQDHPNRTKRYGGWSLICLDAKTGGELWAEPIGADILGAPMAEPEHIFASLQDGSLAAVEPGRGRKLWKRRVSAVSMPVRYRDHLVFHVEDGLSAVDVRSGKTSWTHAMKPDGGPGATTTAFAFPMISGDRAYVNLRGFQLSCLDLTTKKSAWNYSARGETLGAPVAAGGRVYVGTSGATFRSLDAVTGKELWRVKTGGPVLDAPAIVDGRIYIYEIGRGVGCLDAGTPTATGWGMWGGSPDHSGATPPSSVVWTPSAADGKK